MNNKKILLIALVVILIVVITGGLFWYFISNNDKSSTNTAAISNNSNSNISVTNSNINSTINLNQEIIDGFPNYSYFSQSEEDNMAMVSRCLIMTNEDYLNNLPNTIKDTIIKEKVDLEEELAEDIDDGEITTEEAEELKNKCLTFYSKNNLAHAEYLLTTDKDKDGLNLFLEYSFYTNDTKTDTDDDGYSDLIEVESGNNPNNNLEVEQLQISNEIDKLIKTNNFDLNNAVNLCMGLIQVSRDECLDKLSNYADDISYCDDVKYYTYFRNKYRENEIVWECKNRINTNWQQESCINSGGKWNEEGEFLSQQCVCNEGESVNGKAMCVKEPPSN